MFLLFGFVDQRTQAVRIARRDDERADVGLQHLLHALALSYTESIDGPVHNLHALRLETSALLQYSIAQLPVKESRLARNADADLYVSVPDGEHSGRQVRGISHALGDLQDPVTSGFADSPACMKGTVNRPDGYTGELSYLRDSYLPFLHSCAPFS